MIFIGPDDSVFCVDDNGHRVHKFTPEGKLLMTLAPSNGVADTGYNGTDHQSILRSGPPFNTPTDVALAPDGNLFVSDGYGNARVHKFSADGQLLLSWGDPGEGPSQFNQPHGVYVDPEGKVYVADRQNSRIQIFSPQGEFLDQWTEVWWPNALCQDRQQNFCVARDRRHFHVRPRGPLGQAARPHDRQGRRWQHPGRVVRAGPLRHGTVFLSPFGGGGLPRRHLRRSGHLFLHQTPGPAGFQGAAQICETVGFGGPWRSTGLAASP